MGLSTRYTCFKAHVTDSESQYWYKSFEATFLPELSSKVIDVIVNYIGPLIGSQSGSLAHNLVYGYLHAKMPDEVSRNAHGVYREDFWGKEVPEELPFPRINELAAFETRIRESPVGDVQGGGRDCSAPHCAGHQWERRLQQSRWLIRSRLFDRPIVKPYREEIPSLLTIRRARPSFHSVRDRMGGCKRFFACANAEKAKFASPIGTLGRVNPPKHGKGGKCHKRTSPTASCSTTPLPPLEDLII